MKSGACLRTISITAAVKPPSRRPMILIGNAVGKAMTDSISSGLSFLSCTHHLLLEFLIERVDAAEQRARRAASHRPTVERHDREHFLAPGGDPGFVPAAHRR